MPSSQSVGRGLVGVIVGPTAVGKSDLALTLGNELACELVSADSRQIYRRLDIGTAKPTIAERFQMPHHIVDVIDPDQEYSLASFQADAYRSIEAILARGRLPLLVGGTGLYIRAVVEGLGIPRVAPQPELRAELELRADREGATALHWMLVEQDPEAARRIDPRNVRRVIRALEVCLVAGEPISRLQQASPPGYELVFIGLTCGRSVLYSRIDDRVERQIVSGLVDEVSGALALGYDFNLPAMTGLGYRQFAGYFAGHSSLDATIQKIKHDTHRFARQQYAWFRLDDPKIRWLVREKMSWAELIARVTSVFRARLLARVS